MTACSFSRSTSETDAVDRGGMNQQRRRRKPIVIVLEMDRPFFAFGDVGQEFAKAIEHDMRAVSR